MTDLRYLRFDCGPWPAPGRAVELLSSFLPRANPDFEEAYQGVAHFWLEINGDGEVLREIGFDTNGQAVTIAPYLNNYGIFTDSGSPIQAASSDLDPQDFLDAWQAAEYRLAA
jgi:hypothetical protein